jgi:L-ornithine Nalpha-acyltransferase
MRRPLCRHACLFCGPQRIFRADTAVRQGGKQGDRPVLALCRGRYTARLATGGADLDRAQRLRQLVFRTRRGLADTPTDADPFDAACHHILVEETATGTLVCCYRLLPLACGAQIGRSYSAQFYDLAALTGFAAPMLEMGRFCIHPDWKDPDILRLAWGAMTRMVDDTGVQMLFGCSSFDGADADRHADAFAMLKDAHLAPTDRRPGVKSADVYPFARALADRTSDPRAAALAMPPLLRTYLMMGGWVSDHAVVDRDLNTLHVFTGLEITAIPPARARLLRAVAG